MAGYRRAGARRTGAALALFIGAACGSLATLPALADIVNFDVQGGACRTGPRTARRLAAAVGGARGPHRFRRICWRPRRPNTRGFSRVLYAQARYAPVISVLVDGREAATYPALDFPSQVRQHRRHGRSRPGLYLFPRPDRAAGAGAPKLPAGFAIGKPAETGVIREAVAHMRSIGWRAVGHAKAQAGDQNADRGSCARARCRPRSRMAPGPKLRFGQLQRRPGARPDARRPHPRHRGLSRGRGLRPREAGPQRRRGCGGQACSGRSR